jgi:fatty-acyl-CoA synthase
MSSGARDASDPPAGTAPWGPGLDPDLSWLGVLEHHASHTPEKPLAVLGDDVVTYREMLDRSASLAAGLGMRGVGLGDVVGLLSYNSIEFLTTIFAANYVGAIVMPLNWRLAAAELRFILDHSAAVAIVCDEELIDLADQATAGRDDLIRVAVSSRKTAGWERFSDLGDAVAVPERAHARGDDLHRLMYTSGTTGRPKGVMISHANLAWKNYAHITEFGLTGADVGLACGPLYHVGALDLTTTSLIAVGATTFVHRAFEPQQVVDEIERSRVTTLWMAP